jgi:hypothetical protein
VVGTAVIIAGLAVGVYEVNRQRVIAERRFSQLRQLSNKVFDLDKVIRDLPGSTEARWGLVSATLVYLEGRAADTRGNLDLTREVGEGIGGLHASREYPQTLIWVSLRKLKSV